MMTSESKPRKKWQKENKVTFNPHFYFRMIVLLQEDLVDRTELHPGPWSEKFLRRTKPCTPHKKD